MAWEQQLDGIIPVQLAVTGRANTVGQGTPYHEDHRSPTLPAYYAKASTTDRVRISMKHGMRLFLIITLILSSCQNIEKSDNSNFPDSYQLSDFMIGKWIGSEQVTDSHGTYNKAYQIEYVNPRKLVFQMSSPYGGFSEKFEYEFTAEDRILVQNDRAEGGEWVVSRDNDDLLVCIWVNTPCIKFTRE
jgi:hypothetical protein